MDNQIEIYKSLGNATEVRVVFQEETVWLSQKQMAELNAELEIEKAKLEEQQAPVKKSRRIQ